MIDPTSPSGGDIAAIPVVGHDTVDFLRYEDEAGFTDHFGDHALRRRSVPAPVSHSRPAPGSGIACQIAGRLPGRTAAAVARCRSTRPAGRLPTPRLAKSSHIFCHADPFDLRLIPKN
jgi:hypothetical protein